MDTLYLTIDSPDEIISLPSVLDVCNRRVAVVDVKGDFQPRRKSETYYLCCDFVQESYLQPPPGQPVDFQLQHHPILRRLSFKPTKRDVTAADGKTSKVYSGRFNETITKVILLPVTRTALDNFRLYIINSKGEVPSFGDFQLTCTLLLSSSAQSLA